jgi:hypothetical protein
MAGERDVAIWRRRRWPTGGGDPARQVVETSTTRGRLRPVTSLEIQFAGALGITIEAAWDTRDEVEVGDQLEIGGESWEAVRSLVRPLGRRVVLLQRQPPRR